MPQIDLAAQTSSIETNYKNLIDKLFLLIEKIKHIDELGEKNIPEELSTEMSNTINQVLFCSVFIMSHYDSAIEIFNFYNIARETLPVKYYMDNVDDLINQARKIHGENKKSKIYKNSKEYESDLQLVEKLKPKEQ